MPSKIMLVEDDAEFLQYVQLSLERAGYLVIPASNVASAVRWLNEPGSKPDLFILDIGLPDPGMDGIGLCTALKKDPATHKVPIILLSGFADNENRIAAVSAQADLVLNKPIALAHLLQAVRTILGIPRPEKRGLLHRGGLEIDPDAHTIFFNGKQIKDIGTRLFDLFYLLAEHYPAPLNARYILSALRLKTRDEEVAVMVSRLRSTFRAEFGCEFIATVPQEGYRLDPPTFSRIAT